MVRLRSTALALLALALALTGDALADTCSQINDAFSPCQLTSMCAQCVAVSGCEYDIMDGTCTSATNTSAATTYCYSNDTVCASCAVSSSKPTCTGEDGACLCPSLCAIVSSAECTNSSSSGGNSSPASATSDGQSFSMMYVAVALGALSIMIMLYMQRRCREKRVEQHISLVRQEMESRREQRQREREMLRARRPELALDLGTWRESVELHKPQMSNVELETCYYLMMQDEKKKKKKKGSKKGSDHWDSASDGEMKVGIGAITSPIASGVSEPTSLHSPVPMNVPYFAMREEYPSNTTTDGSDSGSEIADDEEEKAQVAIDVDRSADRR